jgi:hypothetical protein
MPGVCGAPVCTPKTCTAGQCGPIANGCGGLLNCGTCNVPQTCGGATASLCGTPASCTNLCLKQVSCPNAGTTSVTGTVYAPNGVDPLPNVLVYVPNGTVQAFNPGVSCDKCSAGVTGNPLVSATSGPDGTFTITNMPVGSNIPLVVQTGRWRVQGTIPSVTACGMTSLPKSLTTLPSTKAQGDIPHMAFATGAVDSLECVLRKVGVADSEFTTSSGSGRIHLYEGDGSVTIPINPRTSVTYQLGGATAGAGTVSETTLVDNPTTLAQYDMLFFPCKGAAYARTGQEQTNIINYANNGGRIFTTHFSYVWLFNDTPFSGTAQWDVGLCDPYTANNATGACDPPDQTGFINTSFPKGLTLATWLRDIGASTTLGQIPIGTLKLDICSGAVGGRGCSAASPSQCTTAGCGIISPSQLWMNIDDSMIGAWPMHYTFNTPVSMPAASQCGRVLFDDFHVENTGYINCPPGNTNPGCVPASTYDNSYGLTFPAECAAGPMTPQEKLLEYMIFDLGSCVTPDVPTCNKSTCAAQNINCGPAGDGCGGVLDCGTCVSPQTCGGGGMPSVCGTPTCSPRTCTQQNIQCGPAGDGCGNPLDCGTCKTGTCGGGGASGQCGTGGSCSPKTCADLGLQCGPAGDGCGNPLDCGTCKTGTCGGAGTPGMCGSACVPQTCAGLGYNCGAAGDGCGGQLSCGTCTLPQTCGGGGKANVCGGGTY